MTSVLLAREENAIRCRASGHAGFAEKGSDIVCAALTVLLRTAMRFLCGDAQIQFESSVPPRSDSGAEGIPRGELAFSARPKEDLALEEQSAAKAKIAFLAEYLSLGFKSLCEEFPRNVEYKEVR